MNQTTAYTAEQPPIIQKPYAQMLRETVNLCSLYGIFAVAVHLVISLISLKTAENHVLFYILDIIASLTGSLLPALVLAYLGRGHIKHYLYTPRQKKTSFFDSFLLVVFGLCGCVVVNMLCTMLESYLPETDHKVYLTFAGTIGNFLLMLTASAVVPAICEELPCRGYVYGSLSPYGHLLSVLLSSFIFGMMHSSFTTALFAFLCGCIFGCIRKTSNRFWLSVIVHFLNNALSALGVFIRVTVNSTAYLSFLRISSQIALFVFAGCIYWLYKRKVRIFFFRKCPLPMTKRKKIWCVITSPVLWLFVIAAIAIKFV